MMLPTLTPTTATWPVGTRAFTTDARFAGTMCSPAALHHVETNAKRIASGGHGGPL